MCGPAAQVSVFDELVRCETVFSKTTEDYKVPIVCKFKLVESEQPSEC